MSTEEETYAAAGAEGEGDVEGDIPLAQLPVDIALVTPSGEKVHLRAVSQIESLLYVRHMLAELMETCHYTNYVFTGTDLQTTETIVLNDFTEIAAVMQQITTIETETCVQLPLTMSVENYTVKRARAHVKRVRDVIIQTPTASSAAAAIGDASDGPEVQENAGNSNKGKGSAFVYPTTDEILAPVKLGDFYKECVFRVGNADPDVKDMKPLSSVVTGVSLSGWNPPPPHRKIQGDLLYVEVVTAEEGIFHVTCTPRGFMVNRSNRHVFDPTPAAKGHFSHELLDIICVMSPKFNAAYAAHREHWLSEAQKKPTEESEGVDGDIGFKAPMDAVATLVAEGNSELISVTPQWNVLNGSYAASDDFTVKPTTLTNDVSRMQDDLCEAFGADDRGPPKEWNEEIQSVRQMPASDINEQATRARYVYRINSDFYEACKSAATAIVDGYITPMNPFDPEASQVYVYNGLFFSKAVDTKETFKLCDGDEACRRSAANDLRNQRIVQSLGISGLCTVMTCMVDYKGARIIGQSIVPGLLMVGPGAARLMYGTIEFDKRISVKTESLKVMESLGKQLFMPVRNIPALTLGPQGSGDSAEAAAKPENEAEDGEDKEALPASIRVDTDDEVVPLDSATTPHVGAIEGKILKGADGRMYALEMVRLTPLDANYLVGKKSTGNIDKDLLSQVDPKMRITYVLRNELISQYVQYKVSEKRQALYEELVSLQKKKSKAKKAQDGKEEGDMFTDVQSPGRTDEPDSEKSEKTSKEATEEPDYIEMTKKITAITAESIGLEISPNTFLDSLFTSEEVEAGEPSVGLGMRSDVDDAAATKDELAAAELANFLFTQMIPRITQEVRQGHIQPIDCGSMVDVLHSRGVNMRYLGYMASQAGLEEDSDMRIVAQGKQPVHLMPPFWLEMLEVEIIARAVKHLLNKHMLASDIVQMAPGEMISTVLNHLFGTPAGEANKAANSPANPSVDSENVAPTQTISKNKKKKKKGSIAASVASSSKDIVASPTFTASRDETLKEIETLVKGKYLYETKLTVPLTADAAAAKRQAAKELVKTSEEGKEDGKDDVKEETKDETPLQTASSESYLGVRLNRLTLLRRICQMCGLRVRSSDYDFKTSSPFIIDDVMGLLPKARTAAGLGSTAEPFPIPEASNLIMGVRLLMNEGELPAAYQRAQEGLQLLQNVVGATHKDVVLLLDEMCAILISAGDMSQALSTAERALSMSVTLDGLDSSLALQQHSKLAAIHIGMMQSVNEASRVSKKDKAPIDQEDSQSPEEKALASDHRNKAMRHLLVTKYLTELLGGARHPELIEIYLKLGALYSNAGNYTVALQLYTEAKQRCHDMIKQTEVSEAVADLYYSIGYYQEASVEQRQVYRILQEIFGEEEEKTAKAKKRLEKYLRSATERNVEMAKVSRDKQEERIKEFIAEAQEKQLQQQQRAIEKQTRQQKKGTTKKAFNTGKSSWSLPGATAPVASGTSVEPGTATTALSEEAVQKEMDRIVDFLDELEKEERASAVGAGKKSKKNKKK